MFEERIVHLPEFSLCSGRFSRFCGVLCMRMMHAKGEMPVDVTEPIAQPLLDFLNDRMRLKAVWAFVIAILDERDGRVQGALAVVPVIYWERKARNRLGTHTDTSSPISRGYSLIRRKAIERGARLYSRIPQFLPDWARGRSTVPLQHL